MGGVLVELSLRVWLGGHRLSPGLGGVAVKAASGLGVGGEGHGFQSLLHCCELLGGAQQRTRWGGGPSCPCRPYFWA